MQDGKKGVKTPPKNRVGRVPVHFDAERNTYVLTYYAEKKRFRRRFKTEKDALVAWKRVQDSVAKHGLRSTQYDASAHQEFAEAKRILNGLDLRDVARTYMENLHSEGENKLVRDAVGEFLLAKEGRGISPRHMAQTKNQLARFADAFGDVPLRSVSGNKVLDWLLSRRNKDGKKLHPITIKSYRNYLSIFFNWCERRRLIARAPTQDIVETDLPVIKSTPKGILSVEQARAMMAWVEEKRPYFVAWHALQLFGGIRNAEANRFRWEWIDFDRRVITIPGWAWGDDDELVQGSKTQDDWALHDLPENVWLWLEKYKSQGKVRAPANKALGIMRRHFRTLEPAINPWPKNAMRHTFCTMLISLHSNAAKVANWSRHTSPRELYDSYVAKLVSKADAQIYCEISPA